MAFNPQADRGSPVTGLSQAESEARLRALAAHRVAIEVDYDARAVTHNGVTIPGAIVSQHLALAIYAVRTGGHDYRVFITREGGLVETLPDGPTTDGRCEPDRRIPTS